MTHFSVQDESPRKKLVKLGYSDHAARRWGRKLQRDLDFQEVAALFALDPTGQVAALRSLGYDVPAKYAAPARPKPLGVAA